MSKSFKCPICGCTEHYEIGSVGSKLEQWLGSGYSDDPRRIIVTEQRALLDHEFSISGDASGSCSLNANFEAYLCKKCGHVQLFAEDMLRAIKFDEERLSSEIAAKQKEVKELNDKAASLDSEKAKIEKRLNELNSLLKSEDITVKQQKEFTLEKEEAQKRLRDIEKENKLISPNLEKALAELEKLKDRLDNVSHIKSVTERRW